MAEKDSRGKDSINLRRVAGGRQSLSQESALLLLGEMGTFLRKPRRGRGTTIGLSGLFTRRQVHCDGRGVPVVI